MSERKFIIYELPEGYDTVASLYPTTTESELKKRILMLTGGDYREGDIDILFHGEYGADITEASMKCKHEKAATLRGADHSNRLLGQTWRGEPKC